MALKSGAGRFNSTGFDLGSYCLLWSVDAAPRVGAVPGELLPKIRLSPNDMLGPITAVLLKEIVEPVSVRNPEFCRPVGLKLTMELLSATWPPESISTPETELPESADPMTMTLLPEPTARPKPLLNERRFPSVAPYGPPVAAMAMPAPTVFAISEFLITSRPPVVLTSAIPCPTSAVISMFSRITVLAATIEMPRAPTKAPLRLNPRRRTV